MRILNRQEALNIVDRLVGHSADIIDCPGSLGFPLP